MPTTLYLFAFKEDRVLRHKNSHISLSILSTSFRAYNVSL